MSRVIDIALLQPAPPPREPSLRPEPRMPSACASGGCGGSPAPPRPPAPSFARVCVNGVEIPADAIAREMQHHPAADLEASWRAAAGALALRELLLQEARRQAIEADVETDDVGVAEADDDARIRLLIERAVTPDAPDLDACRRVYDADPSRFRTPDLFEASHVLVEPESQDDDAWARAEARARAIAVEVGDDRDAFAAAAREFSGCPSAKQDGSLGQVRRGDLVPAIQAALEALPPGTTSREPVRSRFGWHVLRLERRIEGRVLPFETVQPRIADMLEARAWTGASVRWMAALVEAAEIEGVELTPASAAGAFA